LQECFETPLKARKSLVNDFEQQFNLSCEIADSHFENCQVKVKVEVKEKH
jgi:hypothetical protein